MTEHAELTFGNAKIVLESDVITGSVRIVDGMIASVDPGRAVPPGAVDLDGAWLMPGLIELHTDNLEKHLKPRPGVLWPEAAAVVAHDGELASVGITTVFDALRIGTTVMPDKPSASGLRYARSVATRIADLVRARALRIDHKLHLRAEICSNTVLEELAEFGPDDAVRIVSIMDHTPGRRQFADLAKYREYYQGKKGLNDREMDAYIDHNQALSAQVGTPHETGIVAGATALGAVLASHDDTTPAHVARSVEIGVGFAEFPTTAEAAAACREAGVPVMMGAPHVLRGGSHSGNVSALALARDGMLDILSSDYAPSALLMGAMRLGAETGDLAAAIRTVTATPAKAVGLPDRGRIAPGLRGDVITVRDIDGLGVVGSVYVAGVQVA